MRIALITITYNDDYKLREWVQHFSEHKKGTYLHIIVDNGSEPAYLNRVKDAFPESILIERSTNGGCTSAYNDGIRLALADPKVDAIMLLGNDVQIKEVAKLYQFLFSDDAYGMVAPVLLMKDTEDLVEDYGCGISDFLYLIPNFVNRKLDEIESESMIVSAVTGGMNIAKREFYEKVGLQDENLFMYSDEVDMALRAKKAGYKMAVTKNVLSWHQHIYIEGQNRSHWAYFLINRNKVYLANKYFGRFRAFKVMVFQLIMSLKGFKRAFNLQEFKIFYYIVKGNILGFFNIMNNPNNRV